VKFDTKRVKFDTRRIKTGSKRVEHSPQDIRGVCPGEQNRLFYTVSEAFDSNCPEKTLSAHIQPLSARRHPLHITHIVLLQRVDAAF
jgi:hypothetical protein